MTTPEVFVKLDKFLTLLADLDSAAVAFSGGVDSSFLALAAHKVLPGKAAAVTAVSPTLPAAERNNAKAVAAEIGIKYEEIYSDETRRPEFTANDARRCYYCKKYRLGDICRWAKENDYFWVLEGSNADDVLDYRPGLQATEEYSEVKSPLKDSGLTKADIRHLAREWGLSVWDKPSSPCLASRIKYGLPVTPERLRQVEEAEKIVAAYCAVRSNIRVRCHDDLARIEVDGENFLTLAEPRTAALISRKIKELGFSFVALDLAGFKSGSLNGGLSQGRDDS
jgi:uncharacterized protein